MPWNDQSNGSGGQGGGQGGGGGPWGSGPRQPWGQPPRGPQGGGPGGSGGGPGGQGPDLEEMMRRFQNRMRGSLGRGGGGVDQGDGPRGRAGSGLAVVGMIALAGWAASGIYIVDEGEQGVVTRFGAYVDTTGPGLNMHMPWPLEAHQTVIVTRQQRVEIGQAEGTDNPAESLMLTGDENIIDIDFTVLYRLKGGDGPESGAYQWVFNLEDPRAAVRGVAESAMREVIGRTPLEAILTTQRGAVEQQTEELMQRILDAYVSGVEVLEVQLLSAAPPPAVREAFDDVVRAGQDAESEINRAQRFRNEEVPRARGEAARELAAAQAYREQVVREARGDAERFRLVLDEYRQAPRVTRDRMYFETMERIYRGADIMIIDGGSGVTPILPMETLRRRDSAGQAAPAAAPAAPAQPSARPGSN